MRAMLVCALGDLTLDVIVRLAGPIAAGGDTDAEIHIGPGGQAANVAAWAAELGASARFVGKTGADEAGDLVRSKLTAYGVDVLGPIEGRNGSICSLVSPDGNRSMAADRGSARELRADELDPAWFADCDVLHVSGYALMHEPVRGAALHAAGLARSAGAGITADLASWSAIRDSGVDAFSEALRALAPEVVFANEEEERIVGRSFVDAFWIVEARRARVLVRRGRARGTSRRAGSRHHRRGRRPRRGLDRRRARARARSRCSLRPAGRRDAGSVADMSDLIQLSDEVRAALDERQPVVALETTIVAHGFPAPHGVEVGLEMEAAVREAGATPATIGVLGGRIRIGLDEGELARFDSSARKLGPRDLAACAVSGDIGATTVGGVLTAARTVGIRFMGTGGIGGVHRGYPAPPDVSADLVALVASPVLVACSGAKSLLDIPATTEYLETLGIPVLGYRTDTMPLFYEAAGGPAVTQRVDDPESAARIAEAHWELGGCGLLLTNPPPESIEVGELIEEAVAEAARQGVSGQAVTPFVLAFLHDRSGGRTREVNRKLAVANARLAGEVSVAFAGL